MSQSTITDSNEIPVSTQWTLDSANEIHSNTIKAVLMIIGYKTQSKGTGFHLNNGLIITNAHVIQGNNSDEITAISSSGTEHKVTEVFIDELRDIAALRITPLFQHHLSLNISENIEVGMGVSTWGYPLGYNGPAPLFSYGYLSGFKEFTNTNGARRKHLVVNGAFNSGNSGGPLFKANTDEIIGIVVNKHVPFNEYQLSALSALENNRGGLQYSATVNGNTINFAESQLVADLLKHFLSLSQVMIGEAICVSELTAFLKEKGLS